jgi:hypothetical protein
MTSCLHGLVAGQQGLRGDNPGTSTQLSTEVGQDSPPAGSICRLAGCPAHAWGLGACSRTMFTCTLQPNPHGNAEHCPDLVQWHHRR